jgi:Phasin protein
MPTNPSPMLDFYQAQLEASRNFANIVFSNTQKADQLVISAAKSGTGERLKYAQALVTTRDPDGLKTLQATYASEGPDAMFGYFRDMIKVIFDATAEVGKVSESYLDALKTVAVKTGSHSAAPDLSLAATLAEPMAQSIKLLGLWSSASQQFADLAKQYVRAAETLPSMLTPNGVDPSSASGISHAQEASARAPSRSHDPVRAKAA